MNKKDLDQFIKLLEEQDQLSEHEQEKLEVIKKRANKLKKSRVQSLRNKNDL